MKYYLCSVNCEASIIVCAESAKEARTVGNDAINPYGIESSPSCPWIECVTEIKSPDLYPECEVYNEE